MAESSTVLKEYTDTPEDYTCKITKLVSLMKKSKFITIYTGAGISTAASIPDIRGNMGWRLNRLL